MEDLNKTKPGPGGIDGEQASTTRLLKKRSDRIEEESSATTPLTHRLADMDLEEEKKKPNKLLIFGIAALALLLIGGAAYMFLSSDKSGIFSGGGSDINTYGSDSMDADIVEGQSGPIQMPVDKPATATQPGATQPGSTAATAPGSQPATPPVGITSTEREEPPTIPMVRPPVKSEPTPEPKTVQAAKPEPSAPAPVTADANPKTEAKPAPSSAPTSSAPAMTLEQGFNLEKEVEVKEGDLVPMTDDVIKPVIVNRAQAKMPPLAKQLRKTGQVIVRVLVDQNGNVGDAKLVSEIPKGFGFGQASLEAAQMFKYKPARKGNIRVKVWDTIFFSFR